MYRIPSVQDVEKSVLELNNQVRLQSAFLSGQIDKIDGEGQWDGDTVLDKNEAEKILVRTSSLKAELENFKLNLEKYQEAVKRSSSSGKYDFLSKLILHKYTTCVTLFISLQSSLRIFATLTCKS